MRELVQKFRVVRQKAFAAVFLPWFYFGIRYGALGSKFGEFMCSQSAQQWLLMGLVGILGVIAVTAMVDRARVAWPAVLRGQFLVDPKAYEQVFPQIRWWRYFGIGGLTVVGLELVSRLGCWISA